MADDIQAVKADLRAEIGKLKWRAVKLGGGAAAGKAATSEDTTPEAAEAAREIVAALRELEQTLDRRLDGVAKRRPASYRHEVRRSEDGHIQEVISTPIAEGE
ncbi:hypothetical protein [Piscinibacter koreensis]|uniref:Uncharacterized protein n=1 Tax=Piscinibacter koreensis TaxID=2742824 RepID=A0A7Y6TXW9_9BURK|nr:hypothetical protein [Schlegelella koreensis]NUZ07608.1 hypothetical protein [Schlegelella koreensis]